MKLQAHAFLFFAPDGGKWLVPRSNRLFPGEVDPVHITGGGREGSNRYKLPVFGDPEGCPTLLYMFLSFSVVSLSVDCTN